MNIIPLLYSCKCQESTMRLYYELRVDSWDASSFTSREQTALLRYHVKDWMSPRTHFDPKGSDNMSLHYISLNSLYAVNSILVWVWNYIPPTWSICLQGNFTQANYNYKSQQSRRPSIVIVLKFGWSGVMKPRSAQRNWDDIIRVLMAHSQ